MKNYIIAVLVLIIIGFVSITLHNKTNQKNKPVSWVHCIEMCEGTDTDCGECDMLFPEEARYQHLSKQLKDIQDYLYSDK